LRFVALLAVPVFLAAAAARAQAPLPVAPAPATGFEEPPRRGTFLESSLGVFTVFGGSAAVSNAQPYLAFTFGQELGDQATIFASLGIGGASGSCFQVATDGSCVGADSFGAVFVEAGASFGFVPAQRTLLSLKLVAGLTDLTPSPTQNGSGVPGALIGFHFGGGIALDYDTHLDHFAVGADVLLRYTMASYTLAAGQGSQALGLVSLAVMPRIRYVF
jgi:hypothetical protein